MEWLILLFLVPAILVPAVLLGGFSGCSFTRGASLTAAPTDLSASLIIGSARSAIRLTWNNPNPDPVTFEIERATEDFIFEKVGDASSTTFDNTGLDEGTTYFYRVTSIRTEFVERSSPSDIKYASTFRLAFTADLTIDQIAANPLEGFCIVQRIEPQPLGRLLASGARVIITVRGSTIGDLRLDKITISKPAASGDPYDSDADLTEVASSVFVPKNENKPLPAINYALDHTQPLLIAFDISPTPGLGNGRHLTPVPASDAIIYYKGGVAEAGTSDRLPSMMNPAAPPYAAQPSIYFVETIEVL